MSISPLSPTLVDPLADDLINELRKTSSVTLGAMTDALEQLGLRVIEYATLHVIAENPGCNQGEVGKVLGVQRTNMVPIVGGLVDAGYISRRVADGRSHALHLTREGEAMNARAITTGEQVRERFFGGLDNAAEAQLRASLKAIRSKAAA